MWCHMLTSQSCSSYVFSNTLKWTGMRHLHTPYLHIHYYTLHLTRVSSPFCALPPVAAYILEPGHLPSVSLSVEPDLWPLTYLAKGTNKLGHSPHTLSHLPNEGGDSIKVKSRTVVLSCLQQLLRAHQLTCARALHMCSSLLSWSSHAWHIGWLPLTTFNFVELHFTKAAHYYADSSEFLYYQCYQQLV